MGLMKEVSAMKYKIGFHGYEEEKKEDLQPLEIGENKPVKSVVQVRFPSQGRSFAYYNDRFDLLVGDIVFVEGKLEGVQGVVTEVSRSFKIKLSDYKRVISVADTTVKGELFFGGSHLIAFDKSVISYEKVRGWFLPPESDEEVAVGYDDEGFFLDELGDFEIKPEIAKRGFDYYNHNKVVYISVDGTNGRAIVEGSRFYEVCKHEFAALLQLRETLKIIEDLYDDEYSQGDYFAAVSKSALMNYAVDRKEKGSIVLG